MAKQPEFPAIAAIIPGPWKFLMRSRHPNYQSLRDRRWLPDSLTVVSSMPIGL
ncbi:hypothetical protein [Bradyrhizobium sp. USDA 3364]